MRHGVAVAKDLDGLSQTRDLDGPVIDGERSLEGRDEVQPEQEHDGNERREPDRTGERASAS